MTLREFCIREKANVNSETKDFGYIEVRFTTDEDFDIVEYSGAETVADILCCEDSTILDSIIIDIDRIDWLNNKSEREYVIDVMPKEFVQRYGIKEYKV